MVFLVLFVIHRQRYGVQLTNCTNAYFILLLKNDSIFPPTAPQWDIAEAEIKDPSLRTKSSKVLPLKAWSDNKKERRFVQRANKNQHNSLYNSYVQIKTLIRRGSITLATKHTTITTILK